MTHNDPFTNRSLTAPGFFESLRSPIDRLFWAGTETAIIVKILYL